MKQIYKYPLRITSLQTITVPAGAAALAVQWQRDQAVLWALVDPTAPPAKVEIACYGTGEPFDDVDPAAYLGSVQEPVGPFVWHFFGPIGVVAQVAANAATGAVAAARPAAIFL